MTKTTWSILACGAVLGAGLALTITGQDTAETAAPAAVSPEAAPVEAVAPTVTVPETATPETKNPLAFLPEAVATVGDRTITRDELLKEAKPILRMIQMQQGDQEVPQEQWLELARDVTEGLIEKGILLDLAAAEGLKPSPEKGDAELAKLFTEVPEEQVKAVIAQQGMSLDDLKEQLVVAGTIREWVDGYAAKVEVTDQEVAAFYEANPERFATEESVEASHILVRPKELPEAEMSALTPEEQTIQKDKAKAEAKAKAEGLLKRLQDGEDFGTVAEAESDCPSGKANKGSLGEFGRGMMVKPFEDAAFTLEPGTMSGLVETSFGYHIILPTKHTGGGKTPLAEVQDALKGEMQKRQVGEKIKAMLDAEKEKRGVKILI